MRIFEDFHEGQVFETDSWRVARSEILEYAGKFDPHPFHADQQAADGSVHGGLIASGWHIASLNTSLVYHAILKDSSYVGTPAADEVRWYKPVRPDDSLSARLTVQEAHPSWSQQSLGVVRFLNQTLDQNNDVVLSMVTTCLFLRDGHVAVD